MSKYRLYYTENGEKKTIEIEAVDAPDALEKAWHEHGIPDTVYAMEMV